MDEAKAIRDKAEAIRVYARQAKNRRLEIDAGEIRFRAERRLGELMAEKRAAGQMSKGGLPTQKTQEIRQKFYWVQNGLSTKKSIKT